MRRILLLNTQMEAAGAQKAMLQLARGLQARGDYVIVATMYDKGGVVPHFEERYGLTIRNLGMKQPGGNNPVSKVVRACRGILSLLILMRREHPDALQTYSHYSNILGPILGFVAGIPVRVSSQRMSLPDAPKWLLKLDRWVANSRMVHKMTAVSEKTRRFCIKREGIRSDKTVTIPNGINLEEFDGLAAASSRKEIRRELGLATNVPIVTIVARLHVQKGHKYLFESIPFILKKAPTAHFVLVGDGALRAHLEADVAGRGLNESVRFLGVRSDVPALLRASDCFVLPSLWEGMPNCVLEAMAAKIPVIATAVDGIVEVVEDGISGLLVPPKDPQALGRCIVEILTDSALAQSLGQAGRRRVETAFSLERMIDGFSALYDEILKSFSDKRDV
jgi:glycosyltransferase involved in cell wall biosynthesis